MAGFLYAGTCFSSSSEAVDAYFGAIPPSISIDHATGFTHLVHYVGSAGNWAIERLQLDTAGAASLVYSTPVSAPVFQSCDTPNTPAEAYSDGLFLGWGVAAACVLAWGVMALRKGL
jgi:hypothetical protein